MTMQQLLKQQFNLNERTLLNSIADIEGTIFEAADWFSTMNNNERCEKPDINAIVEHLDWLAENVGKILKNIKDVQALAHSQQQIAKELQSSTCKISKK